MKYKFIILLLIIICSVTYLKLDVYIPCLFHLITKLYCPGCGMTRALKSLLNLEFYQAFRYNSLIILMPVILINYYVLKNMKLSRIINIFLLIIVLTYGILRNIEYFDYLRPTTV